ncbi:MAG TPA: F0F1 ATP synthase subunit delta [Candidatus Saccharimonadales bacterium]|nr:F0F1 ATP synthase subunit delta [Candidatus Saccharimonadales bacterium]
MTNFSRRQLARYAVDELAAKTPVSKLSVKLAAVLLAGNRHKEADLLIADIGRELEDRGLQVTATVTSAYPLSLKLKRELNARLKKLTTTKAVVIQEQTDPAVIGGLRAETAERSWDMTLKKMLNDIREA